VKTTDRMRKLANNVDTASLDMEMMNRVWEEGVAVKNCMDKDV